MAQATDESKFFRLKVDNTPPRLLYLRTQERAEWPPGLVPGQRKVADADPGDGPEYRHWVVGAHRLIHVRLPGSLRHARLILRDRADNTLARKLAW